jgi:hypothetical protein
MEDVLTIIYAKLNFNDVIVCSLVNVIFNTVCHSEMIWKKFLFEKYKNIISNNYYEMYKSYHKLSIFTKNHCRKDLDKNI